MKNMVLLIVISSGQENAYKNCGFICFHSLYKEHAYKNCGFICIKNCGFLGLRHAGEPLASCPRLHGSAKAKKKRVVISISIGNAIKP